MVKTITIDNDARFEQSSFIIVRKYSNFYVKNDKYDFFHNGLFSFCFNKYEYKNED